MKRFLLIFTLLTLLIVPTHSQTGLGNDTTRPKVAVVLSGGGAKGVAHISALKVIEEAGIPIDMVCGTSMGALIGSLYCLGYDTEFLDSLVRSQDWASLLSDRTDPSHLTLRQREEQNTYAVIRGLGHQPSRGGLIRGRNLESLFRRLCAGWLDSISFDSMPLPFACVATDIVSGREVVFHNGHLIKAMRASMAIPGVFTPVRMGDMVLVDGGLRNNYPADIARSMGADIIIGVSVQDLLTQAGDLNDVMAVMGQIISINSRNKFPDNIKLSDIFIHVDVSGYSAASFTSASIDSLLRRGDEAARSLWDRLIALRQHYGLDSVAYPRLARPVPPSAELLDQSPHIQRTPIAFAGFHFDSEEMGAVQLAVKAPLSTQWPIGIVGTLRLGKRIMARAEVSMLTRHPGFNPTLSYTFRNNDLDIYTAGTRTHNLRYYQHSVDLTPFDLRLRRYDLKAGVRWDYFNYYGQLLSADGDMPSLDDDHYFSYHASADLNTENDWYFPTRGTRFHAAYAYRTTNLYSFEGRPGISDLDVHWRLNLPLSKHWALQPMLYGRMLFSDDIPLAYTNAIGGNDFGLMVEQQMPLVGLGHIELAERQLAAAQLQLQCNILTNHYLQLRAVVAYHTDNLTQFGTSNLIFGLQAAYNYNTIIGPLGVRLGYSSRTHAPYFYINIGHIL